MTDEKSHPIPSQVPIFIGAALDFQKELARPSVDQVLNLRQCVAPSPLFPRAGLFSFVSSPTSGLVAIRSTPLLAAGAR